VTALGRTFGMAVAGGALVALSLLSAWLRRPAPAERPCADGGVAVLVDAGAGQLPRLECHAEVPAAPLAASAVLLGTKLDLNRAPLEELERLPGVPASLARALVTAREARPGGFRDWSEVDELPGVGPATLERLQAVLELRP
jgi:competence ComEA-like helix-hairpin-helix protein